MKRRIKKVLLLVVVVIGIILFSNKVQASYTIENMDIQATVNEDGSVAVEQTMKYKFSGSYNGIYLTIPYQLKDSEYKEVIKDGKLNENLYNASTIGVTEVSQLVLQEYQPYEEVKSAYNGKSGVYTVEREAQTCRIKVYSPSNNTTKVFKLKYTLQNVCVSHNDIGELYYNFIGGGWECGIGSLNIDIHIPQNKQEILVWGHGPYNGKSKIVSNQYVKLTVDNVKPGQYVAARVVFDKSSIPNANKKSGLNAFDIIRQEEEAIIENKEEKARYTNKILLFAVGLCAYWVILLLIYEKDKKYIVQEIEEEELFEKYNPMIAGCIQGSREILARDMIAVILRLINKKIINLEITQAMKGLTNYNYKVSKNEQNKQQMDEIESYVYDWLFGKEQEVQLAERLKKMPKETQANKKFKQLNTMVERKLASMGANKAKVPMILRILNIAIFIISLLVIFDHMQYNLLDLYNEQTRKNVISMGIEMFVCMLPFMIAILYIPINLIIMIRHRVNHVVQKFTGQKLVTTTITLIVIFGIIMILTGIFTGNFGIVADELLICMGLILILTDNLMLKNDAIMIEDFSKLNALKDKIENYTLLEDKDIEYITLWEEYLSYGVAFGVADKIIKRIKGLHLDDDLLAIVGNNMMLQEFILSDYYMFYQFASLDRRFMRGYKNAIGNMASHMGSSSGGGYSRGGRRRFLWRRRLFWRRRPRWPEAVLFKKRRKI